MQPMHLPAGAAIFHAGDPSLAVYLIEEGEVAITVPPGIEVARLHPGDLFGESGVLEGRPRSATATAITGTTVVATEAEMFLQAFGMENDRALSLVKLLCRRLRTTTMRSIQPRTMATEANPSTSGHAAIRLLPDSERLSTGLGMTAVDVLHLPFQVGNRYGGETLPIVSSHHCCIPARGDTNLASPHFEILRRDGHVGVRDLGSVNGTMVNRVACTRTSMTIFVPLRAGDNEVIAGRPESPFRFRIQFAGN